MKFFENCSCGKILNFYPHPRYRSRAVPIHSKIYGFLNFSQFVIALVQNADMLFLYAAVKHVIIVF